MSFSLKKKWTALRKSASPYWRLMRFDKPVGTLLLLWPTLWAVWMAGKGHPDPFIVLIFVLGVIVMRACGCVINDMADRRFDAHVTRTRTRPLAVGDLSTRQAFITFIALVLIAFLLVLQLNRQTVYWSLGAIVIASLYPFMKRYTYFPQVVLGAAFAWAIPMAFVAQEQPLDFTCWLLYVSTLLWVLAYDTIYGMVDRDDDVKIGIKSTAILFAEADCLMISIIHVLALSGFAMLALRLQWSLHFWWGWGCALVLTAWQLWLIRTRQRDACFAAFRVNNWNGVALTVGILWATQTVVTAS